MFSASIIQEVNLYSQVQKSAAVRGEQPQTHHGTAQTRAATQTDTMVLSEEARRLYGELVLGVETEQEKKEQLAQEYPRIPPVSGWENLVNDPIYAEEMAHFSAYHIDRPLFRMNPDAIQVPGGVIMDGSMLYPDGTPVIYSDGSYQKFKDTFTVFDARLGYVSLSGNTSCLSLRQTRMSTTS